MARAFTRLSVLRLLGALAVLGTLSACVAPRHGGYHGGGYGRSYAHHQPVYRGGFHHGHQRHWR